jgi:hypothetical protein
VLDGSDRRQPQKKPGAAGIYSQIQEWWQQGRLAASAQAVPTPEDRCLRSGTLLPPLLPLERDSRKKWQQNWQHVAAFVATAEALQHLVGGIASRFWRAWLDKTENLHHSPCGYPDQSRIRSTHIGRAQQIELEDQGRRGSLKKLATPHASRARARGTHLARTEQMSNELRTTVEKCEAHDQKRRASPVSYVRPTTQLWRTFRRCRCPP